VDDPDPDPARARDPSAASPSPSDRAPGDGSATEGGFVPPQGVDEVAGLREALAEAQDRIKREQAEFLNDRRRVERQAEERVRYSVQSVVTDLLPVTDAIHNAIEGLKDTEHERRVAEGLRMVEKQLLDILAGHGVERIDALNRPFDPARHEALLEMEGGPSRERTVLQVVRPGFTLHGRVVRPAHVVVSRPAPPDASGDADEPEAGGGGGGEKG
jgi:molecular chaperone GrpE